MVVSFGDVPDAVAFDDLLCRHRPGARLDAAAGGAGHDRLHLGHDRASQGRSTEPSAYGGGTHRHTPHHSRRLWLRRADDPREYDVLRLVAAGHTDIEIGDAFGPSINMVKPTCSASCAKLNARNRDSFGLL
jgi:DNA-binding CsgD family transcriptional regulator